VTVDVQFPSRTGEKLFFTFDGAVLDILEQVQEAHKQMFLREWRAYVAPWPRASTYHWKQVAGSRMDVLVCSSSGHGQCAGNCHRLWEQDFFACAYSVLLDESPIQQSSQIQTYLTNNSTCHEGCECVFGVLDCRPRTH